MLAGIGQALRSRSNRQCATVIAHGRLINPEVGQAVKMIGDLTRAALKRAGRLIGGGNTQADQFACAIEQREFGRIIAVVQTQADNLLILKNNLTAQSKWSLVDQLT